MGGGFARRVARQHSDLTLSPDDRRAVRTVLLILLAVDGVISAVLGTFLLPIHLGPIPFPISALISGLLNAALVWVGLQWTSSPRLAAIPLWTWLATVGAFTLGGPGDDIVFGGSGLGEYAVVVLLVLGVAPPAWMLWRETR